MPNLIEILVKLKGNENVKRSMTELNQGFELLDKSVLSAVGPMEQFLSFSNLPMLVSAAGAVWELSGAIGVIPAAAGSAALAMGAAKIAFIGFGDAMKNIGDPKKFAESIKFMAPAMQDAMRSIQKLVPAWDTLKKRVQDAAWSNINTHIDELGRKYLPILNSALVKTASGMNRGVTATAQFLETSGASDDMAHSFDNMSGFVEKIASTMPNLVQSLLNLVTVGSDFLPAMGDGLVGLIERFTLFLQKARESGQLKEWIQSGIDAVKMLSQIVSNVFGIIASAFQASGQSGAGFLVVLRDLTAKMLEWTKSAEGQEKIRALFEALSHVAFPLLQILPSLAAAVFSMAQMFASLPGPVQSIIGGFIGWASVVGLIIGRIGPLVGLLMQLKLSMIKTAATAIASFTSAAASSVASAATVTASWVAASAAYAARMAVMVASTAASTATMVATWIARMTVMAAASVAAGATAAAAWIAANIAMIAATGGIILIIGALIAIVVLLVQHWDWVKEKASALGSWIKGVWDAIYGAISSAVSAIIDFVKEHWQAILAVVMGPIGILIGLLITNWEKIKAIFKTGVDAVLNAVGFLARLPEIVIGYIANMVQGAISKATELVNWFKDLRSKILGAIGNILQAMGEVGWNIIQGIWSGLQRGWSWLVDKVQNLARELLNAAKRAIGIASKSKAFEKEFGAEIPPGAAAGINSTANVARKAVQSMASGLLDSSALGRYRAAAPGINTAVAHGMAGGQTARVVLEFRGGSTPIGEFLARIIRDYVKVQGGDVQTTFGRNA